MRRARTFQCNNKHTHIWQMCGGCVCHEPPRPRPRHRIVVDWMEKLQNAYDTRRWATAWARLERIKLSERFNWKWTHRETIAWGNRLPTVDIAHIHNIICELDGNLLMIQWCSHSYISAVTVAVAAVVHNYRQFASRLARQHIHVYCLVCISLSQNFY